MSGSSSTSRSSSAQSPIVFKLYARISTKNPGKKPGECLDSGSVDDQIELMASLVQQLGGVIRGISTETASAWAINPMYIRKRDLAANNIPTRSRNVYMKELSFGQPHYASEIPVVPDSQGLPARDKQRTLRSTLMDLKRGDVLLVSAADRFSRNVQKANLYLDYIHKKGAKLMVIFGDKVLTSDVDRDMIMRCIETGQLESNAKSDRIKKSFDRTSKNPRSGMNSTTARAFLNNQRQINARKCKIDGRRGVSSKVEKKSTAAASAYPTTESYTSTKHWKNDGCFTHLNSLVGNMSIEGSSSRNMDVDMETTPTKKSPRRSASRK